MGCVHLLRRLLERQHRSPLTAAFRERVATGARDEAHARRLDTRLGQLDQANRAEPDVATFAGDDGSREPTPRARFCDNEIESIAIGVTSS